MCHSNQFQTLPLRVMYSIKYSCVCAGLFYICLLLVEEMGSCDPLNVLIFWILPVVSLWFCFGLSFVMLNLTSGQV